jgi:predicted metal-dependent phosphoesterase TrpH
MKIDLHIHSSNSDGLDTIEELVPKIAESGIDVFSLTDHDRTDGWDQAALLANKYGLSFIPGVEITTKGNFPGTKSFGIHLLAYLPDPNNRELQELLFQNRQAREVRMRKYVDNLAADFSGLSYELVVDLAQAGSTLGRPDLANALVHLGKFASVTEAWASGVLDRENQKYYVSTQAPDVKQTIQVVRKSGGVPVIAHPLARNENGEDDAPNDFKLDNFQQLVDVGLLGLETNHIEVSAHRKKIFDEFARSNNLVTTGSSDYHGLEAKPNNPLGIRTTELEQLRRILELGTGSKPTLNHSL